MAALTWREVSAPNFSGALDGLRVSSGLMNQGLEGFRAGLAGFQASQQDDADRQGMARLLSISDPAAYQAALAGGAANGMSLRGLQLADQRGSALLDQAAKQQRMAQDQYTFGRTQTADARMDRAGPGMNEAILAANRGDQSSFNRIAAGLDIPPEQLMKMVSENNTLRNSASSRELQGAQIANMNQNASQSRWRFGREQQEYLDVQSGLALAQQIAQNAPTSDAATALIDAEMRAGRVTPGVARAAMGQLSQMGFQGVFSPGSGGGATVDPSLTLMTGGKQLPSDIQTVGQFVDSKSDLLKHNPKGTATGMYQITADTWKDFAPKVLGPEWRNANINDPEVQDKVGEAIWDSAKSSPEKIKGRFASFSDREAAMFQNAPWSDVRDLVSQKEASVSASSVIQSSLARRNSEFGNQQAQLQVQERLAQNFGERGQSPSQYIADLSNTSSVEDMTASLRKEGSPLAGTSQRFLDDKLRKIMRQAGANPAQAARMLTNSLESDDTNSFLARTGRRLSGLVSVRTPNLGSGRRINDAKLEENIKQFNTGQTSNAMQVDLAAQTPLDAIKAAQTSLDNAQTAYANARRLAEARPNPGFIKAAEEAKKKYDLATQVLKELQYGLGQDSMLSPTRQRTVPGSVDTQVYAPLAGSRNPLDR